MSTHYEVEIAEALQASLPVPAGHRNSHGASHAAADSQRISLEHLSNLIRDVQQRGGSAEVCIDLKVCPDGILSLIHI